ncbi:zf-HC2 domain-containing protein [Actinoplanes sp. DH11]|uniref:zf-HC2 domain-containing protein n=1 Tax=Actinoplanes sp. DH11 TaxID=2857011 RepID=UPI001E60EB66|nr:zf-HC2 domain-containing protein [Actinoplanes sp. DH11]
MSDLDEHGSLHRLLGGYLLGGLDEADTDRLDEHLRDCADCRAELDRLAPVPEMLQHLPDARHLGGGVPLAVSPAARPSSQNIEGLLSRMRAEKHKEVRVNRTRWLVAAAVVLIAAAAIGYGVFTNTGAQQQGPPEALPSVELLTARFEPAAGSSVTGSAVITPKVWGVSVALDVSRMSGEAPFLCLVRTKAGATEQAAVWGDTPDDKAKVVGGSSVKVTDLDAILITDKNGKLIGTAPVV